jgi:hypothetical protein
MHEPRIEILDRRQATLVCLSAVLSLLLCAGLCSAAMLAPAPVDVLPVVVATCLALPLLSSWRLPSAVGVLRAGRRSLNQLRRELERLPETEHPLGL